ncbi:MAG: sulfur transferase domain-containing protein [Gammaproteobacteria bacterium]
MNKQMAHLEIKNLCGPLPLAKTAYSGGQPTRAQLAELAGFHIGTVINLRPDSEMGDLDEAAVVSELGMAYRQISISDKTDLTRENVERFATALNDSAPPLFIHCAGGNRVGALVALMAFWLDQVSAERALEMGIQSGLTGLREAVADRLR